MSVREFGYRPYSGSKKGRISRLWTMGMFDVRENWRRSRFAKVLVICLVVWQIVWVLVTVLLTSFMATGASTLFLYSTIDIPGGANDIQITYSEHYYLGQENGLLILDPDQLPTNSYSTASPVRSLKIDLTGMFTFLNLGDAGIEILNTSIPFLPNRISSLNTSGTVNDILLLNGPSSLPQWLLIADGDSGLQIADVSDPFLPTIINNIDTEGTTLALAFQDTCLFLADGDNGLVILNVTEPEHPTILSYLSTPEPALDVAVTGNYTFISMGQAGILVVNIANPSNPYQLGLVDTPGSANQVVAFNNYYALIADGVEGIHAIYVPVNNPSNPKILLSANTTSVARSITLGSGSVPDLGITISPEQGEATGLAILYVAEEGQIEIGIVQLATNIFEQAEFEDTANIRIGLEIIIGLSGFIILALIAVLGGGLIANDRRNRTLDLYLTRIRPQDYIIGKFLAIFSISASLMLVLGILQIVAFGMLQNLDLIAHFDLVLSFLALVLVAAVVYSSLLLAFSSLTDQSRYASIIFYVGLIGLNYIISTIESLINPVALWETRKGYLSLFSPLDVLEQFGMLLRRRLVEISIVEPWMIIAALGVMVALSWAIIINTLVFKRE
ncbi:MAG: ABC transporter permease subunit [Candidatus Hermodarchaeota archaeon]